MEVSVRCQMMTERSEAFLFCLLSAISKVALIYTKSLTLEALRVAEDPKNPHKIRSLKESELTYLSYPYLLGRGKYSIPMGRDARFYIHYSPLDMSKFIPTYKIYEGLVQPDQIKRQDCFNRNKLCWPLKIFVQLH